MMNLKCEVFKMKETKDDIFFTKTGEDDEE